MKTSTFAKILMLALAALVACQAGFAQVSSHAVVPTATAGHMRPYVWMKGALAGSLTPSALPSFCNSAVFGPGTFLYCPNGLQSIYGANTIPSGNGGKGKTIAIVDAYHYAHAASDLSTFSTDMGLPQLDGVGGDPTLTIVGCTAASNSTPPSYGVSCGAAGGPADSGWELEEMLDLEYAHAMAPNANILMVEAHTSGGFDLYGGVNYAAGHADIVSDSWGGGEYSGQTTDDTTFAQGTPILFSSGDNGDEVCTAASGGVCTAYAVGVQFPCSSPNVTCVGGTTLFPTGSPLKRLTETGWSGLGAAGGSGGGCSTQENLPFYQNVGAIHGGNAPTLCGTKRAVPDIAAVADPNTGVAVWDTGNAPPGDFLVVGGTSLATPVTAGLFAQLIAARATFGQTVIPYLNPAIYAAAVRSYTYFLFDVISGNNGYAAGTGYDLVTGLGVSNVTDMANRFFGLIYVPLT